MATMLAAVLHDFDRLELEQTPVPAARNFGEVVVRIKSCGFCATDYKAIRGIRRNVGFPFIPGHEPAGVVVETGPGVLHFKVGDEVICQPSGYCGFCEPCRTGNTHYCEHAFTTGGDGPEEVWPGAFAEYMLTRETACSRSQPAFPSTVTCLTGAPIGCLERRGPIQEMQVGDDVVIIGSVGLG
jgi:D-arabinose 1-dehydrogenase-like Zn-dependent alcohol dehydrogenase